MKKASLNDKKISGHESAEANKEEAPVVPKGLLKKRAFFGIAIIVVFMMIGAMGAAFYFLYKTGSFAKNREEEKVQGEAAAIIESIDKLVILPQGETPTVATVTDPEKLKEQNFFASALAGDKVIIYTNAKKAILYRPSENKIVEMAPLNIGR